MYTIVPERQENYLGDTLIYSIPRKHESGTLTTKFDVQEIEDEDNYVEGFKCYLAEKIKWTILMQLSFSFVKYDKKCPPGTLFIIFKDILINC